MIWYKPSTWFQKTPVEPKSSLYCDNPQCRIPLTTPFVVHDEDHREIYHDFDCARLATAHRVLATRSLSYASAEQISLESALDLLREGKLNQSGSLESKVTE